MTFGITGEGPRYQPNPAQLEKRLAQLDRPGHHIWIMTGAWAVTDPQSLATRGPIILDQENLVSFAGPGCYKCEQPWSRKIAAQPCHGSVTDMMP